MRTYLVVIDNNPESALALRFAARRAARTGGHVHLVAVTEPPPFVAWAGVQATIDEEERARVDAMTQVAASQVFDLAGIRPTVTVRQGEGAAMVREILAADDSIAALVLAAAATGAPGPLVAHFCGPDAGLLPVPVMVVPGALSPEAIDQLS